MGRIMRRFLELMAKITTTYRGGFIYGKEYNRLKAVIERDKWGLTDDECEQILSKTNITGE